MLHRCIYTAYTALTEPITLSHAHIQFSSVDLRVRGEMMLHWMNPRSLNKYSIHTQTDTQTHRLFSYPLASASSSSIHVKICVAKMDDTSSSWMSWVDAMTKQLRFAWERETETGNGQTGEADDREDKVRRSTKSETETFSETACGHKTIQLAFNDDPGSTFLLITSTTASH